MGGAQTHVSLLIEYMKNSGHTVLVMASPGGWLEERCKKLHITFYPNIYFKNSYNPFNLIQALHGVRTIAYQMKPQVVHCHSGGGGFFGRLGTIGIPAKKIFTAHGWSFRRGVPIPQRIIGWLGELLMRPLTDMTICVSEFDRTLGLRSSVISLNSSVVVYNGVPIQNSKVPSQIHEKIHIIFAGRYAPPKRQDLLIEAVSYLPEDLRDRISIQLLGNGPEREQLENLAEKLNISSITHFDSLPTERMGEAYLSSNLLVLISDYEAFPMVILEAMSYGLPIIASKVGGIPEIVDEHVGVLIPPRSTAEAISKILQRVLSNTLELERYGVRAKRRIEESFSVELMCKKVEELYAITK